LRSRAGAKPPLRGDRGARSWLALGRLQVIDPSDVIAARHAGEIRYAVASEYSGDLDRVLAKFGLLPDKSMLIEIDRSCAVAVLGALLEKDMAYGSSLMSPEAASSMAERILASREVPASKYFSNANWPKEKEWNSLTESTFDSGLLVTIGANQYFCIWFEDED